MDYAARHLFLQEMKSFAFALLLHGVIAVLLLANFYWPGKSERHIENVIKARVVLDESLSKPERAEKSSPPAASSNDVARRKAAALEKQKQRQEKLAQERARKAAALKKKQQQAAAAKKRQAQAKQELMRALEAEERERTAQANEARAQVAMSQFEGLIKQQITRNWNKPSGVPAELECLVRVRLAAGGEILGVTVIQSSGNALFDRSVENAVYKAAPLPVPEDPELFKYVREINIRFNPED